MKLLKQKGTGEIYVWTEVLAQRDDMELIESAPVAKEAAPEQPQEVEAVQQEPEQAPEAENTSQNSGSASAEPEPDPVLNEAMQAFRRQVGKGGKKATQDDQPSGDA
jgi:hypothetical protein